MSLLDRYLHAVGSHLPARQRDDILAELGEDLRARFDERADELGRPLTEDDEADLLKPYGRPILLAARYRKQQYLVGPNLFPYYWKTLTLALAIALVVHVAVLVTLAVAGRPLGRAAEALWRFPTGTALSVFTWVTIVFALLDLAVARIKVRGGWDPRTLPRATRSVPRPSRFETALDLVISAVFVVWWVTVPRSPYWLTRADASVLMAPAWTAFYAPVLIVVIASMAVKAVVLVRPEWTTFRFVTGLLTTTAGLVLLAMLLGAGDLVVPGVPGVEAATLARVVNMGLRISFGVAMLVSVIATAVDIRRYTRGGITARPDAASHVSS